MAHDPLDDFPREQGGLHGEVRDKTLGVERATNLIMNRGREVVGCAMYVDFKVASTARVRLSDHNV